MCDYHGGIGQRENGSVQDRDEVLGSGDGRLGKEPNRARPVHFAAHERYFGVFRQRANGKKRQLVPFRKVYGHFV